MDYYGHLLAHGQPAGLAEGLAHGLPGARAVDGPDDGWQQTPEDDPAEADLRGVSWTVRVRQIISVVGTCIAMAGCGVSSGPPPPTHTNSDDVACLIAHATARDIKSGRTPTATDLQNVINDGLAAHDAAIVAGAQGMQASVNANTPSTFNQGFLALQKACQTLDLWPPFQ
jgi:hypothetical protein